MVQLRADPCLWFPRHDGSLSAIVLLQVDRSVIVGTESFVTTKDKTSALFLSKPRKRITANKITFNGAELSISSDSDIDDAAKENNGARNHDDPRRIPKSVRASTVYRCELPIGPLRYHPIECRRGSKF